MKRIGSKILYKSKTLKIVTLSILLLLSVGCQQVTEVEFYPPSKEIEAYCTKASNDTPGRGPIKSVKGRSGSPDFSDSKSFSFSILNF